MTPHYHRAVGVLEAELANEQQRHAVVLLGIRRCVPRVHLVLAKLDNFNAPVYRAGNTLTIGILLRNKTGEKENKLNKIELKSGCRTNHFAGGLRLRLPEQLEIVIGCQAVQVRLSMMVFYHNLLAVGVGVSIGDGFLPLRHDLPVPLLLLLGRRLPHERLWILKKDKEVIFVVTHSATISEQEL